MTYILDSRSISSTRRGLADIPARLVVTPTGTIIRGCFPSVTAHRMIAYEQLLERDALYLFEFCPLVLNIQAQPFKLHYSHDGRTRRYTPDYALTLADGSRLIIEIKPMRSLEKPEIKAKFEAIAAAMARQEHRFMVLCENDIRKEPRLTNLKLLHPFLHLPYRAESRAVLAQLKTRLQECKALPLAECMPEGNHYGELLYLLAHGLLSFDFMQPIGPEMAVSLPNEEVDHALINWL